MASKKKESEGIALLSMYGDEEEEEDDDIQDEDMEDNDNSANDVVVFQQQQSELVVNMEEAEKDDDDEPETVKINDDTTSFLPAVKQQVINRKSSLTIVDYGHDEAALSPEPHEGEVAAAGRVMFGAELQTVNETIAPNKQSTPPQPSDQSQTDASFNSNRNETECAQAEEAVNVTTEDGHKEMNSLDEFLPPPPTTKCSDELQEKITKFLLLKKKTGRSFNSEVRNRKEYRNPDFLLHAVTYQDIDQIGSCFSKDVFDPHGYDMADYYDEIEADLKREMERKEQEKKKNQKIEFLSGGTQSVAIPTPKVMPIPAMPPVAGGGSNPVSATGTREGRPNKKSKWDKVDEDRRHPSGHAPISSVGAAFLSAGTGYTAFAQQRRREEERRSSDRK